MKLKKIYDYRAIPVIYSVPEAVDSEVSDTFGENMGSVEHLEGQMQKLIGIVGKLVAMTCDQGQLSEVLSSWEPASDEDVKKWEER